MQAQAAGDAGGGEGLSGLIQNPKVQIGVIAAGAIALIVVIYVLFFNNGGSTAPPVPGANSPSSAGSNMPAPGGSPAGPGSGPLAQPGGSGGNSPGSMPAAAAPAPAAPRAPGPAGPGKTAEAPAKNPTPGVPTRGNPFKPNKEIEDVLKSIPALQVASDPTAPPQNLYVELNPPKPKNQVNTGDEGEGPPIPPMRVAGFVQGAQLSAILQLGSPPASRFEQAIPGKKIQYGPYTYTVERLEQDKVVLVNHWEIGERKGTQRIEVSLSGSANRSAGTPGTETVQ